jgi:hypothetical protein
MSLGGRLRRGDARGRLDRLDEELGLVLLLFLRRGRENRWVGHPMSEIRLILLFFCLGLSSLPFFLFGFFFQLSRKRTSK